ncbi:hypothetical protein [Bradyrhizobium lablabi]|jgi:hypothetical protein|nr:hypothetical protein [Bradyrhizobium lablabi]
MREVIDISQTPWRARACSFPSAVALRKPSRFAHNAGAVVQTSVTLRTRVVPAATAMRIAATAGLSDAEAGGFTPEMTHRTHPAGVTVASFDISFYFVKIVK